MYSTLCDLATGISLVAQVFSNFATWVSWCDLGIPRKYKICTISMIIGATCKLTITMGDNCGKGRGVKGFSIVCTSEVLEVEPKCTCYGLKCDNVSSWPLISSYVYLTIYTWFSVKIFILQLNDIP